MATDHVGRMFVPALLALCGTAGVSLASLPQQTIALTGTSGPAGPGIGAGVTFSGIGGQQPTVNNAGQVGFRGNASTAGTPQGFWIHGGGANSNVALAGGAMPGGGTYTSGTSGIINSTHINASGEWAFRLGGTTGLFATNAATPTRVLLGGDTAPGTGGATYGASATGMPFFNDAGQVGYIGTLTTGTGSPAVVATGATANNNAIWTGMPGATGLALRQNDAVLSLDAGGNVRVGAFQNLSMAMNGSGRYGIVSNLQGSVTTGTGAGSNSAMIATNRTGSLEVVARVGNAAPNALGAPTADLYRALSTAAVGFNDAGHVAFVSTLRDAAGAQTSTSSLFTDSGSGVLRQVARNATPLPAIQGANGSEFAGALWGSMSNAMLTGSDSLVFSASMTGVPTGTTNVLLTMSPTDTFTKVARSGDVAIINGAPLGGDAFFTSFSNTASNAAGQIAFQAILNGNGIFGGPGGNNSAIFAYDPSGGTCLVARTSDLFEVAPGDLRQISAIGGIVTSGGQDGRLRNLSDNGKLAFQLDFTDGSSGVFLVTIPAPAALPLLGALGVVGARRRR